MSTDSMFGHTKLIVIGASLGGFDTLKQLFPHMQKDFPIPVAVVLHRQQQEDQLLSMLVREHCLCPVREAVANLPISPGITLAPPAYHLLVDGDRFALSVDPPVHYARPSIDVLFESAADNFTQDACGILLSGSGIDGVAGLKAIRQFGGLAIVQDPATAAHGELLEAAIEAKAHNKLCTLEEIACALGPGHSSLAIEMTAPQ